MPENEFEKKVSSKMQDLKFKPSEKVWLQVEERIRKKKKRRVFLIVFFIAGLGLLGYWQWNNAFDKNVQKDSLGENGVTKVDTTLLENKPATEVENKFSETVTTKEEKNSQEKTLITKKKEEVTIGQSISKTNPTIAKANQANQSKKKGVKKESKINKASEVNETDALQITSNEPPAKETQKANVNIKSLPNKDTVFENNKVMDVKGEEKKPEESKVDSTSKLRDEIKENVIGITDSSNKIENLKDSAASVKKDPHGKKWKWGLEFTPGTSSLNEDIFSFDMKKSADAYANPTTGSGFPVPPAPPSVSSSGFAFQIGAFAKKEVTLRSSLSIGLRYGYYSDHIHVGRDTIINSIQLQSLFGTGSFYRASNSSRGRTNRYHFIEIPIGYDLQLNKNKQKPFTWNAGFTISRLIATNAVMYDTAFGGIYYKNEELLNRTQFSLTTGFSWTIANNKNIQWAIGPVADIHLNSLLDNPFENKKYLILVGLRSRILFSSKK